MNGVSRRLYRINPEINLIVLTDSEQILGIGDQGANGIGISVAKLVIYTLVAGINPRRMLPIMIDVGTNNKKLLKDPLYLGWRHPRISRKDYDEFVSKVIESIKQKFPDVFLQWEDFGKEKARCNLDHYQNKICTFNDDIQGTGAVTMAAILNALQLTGTNFSDHRIVIFGAGTAGCGIADRISEWVVKEGLSRQESISRFWLIDSEGLITDDRGEIDYFKATYARSSDETQQWDNKKDYIGLLDVIRNVKPTILIGTSAVPGAFNKEVVTTMASSVERPIIFPLSNPPTRAEANPQDILNWTEGRSLVAAGSPYDDVEINGKVIAIAQCNNAFIFPGLGLGIISAQARRVSQGMIDISIEELSNSVDIMKDPHERLLPQVSKMPKISRNIAVKVAKKAVEEGLAGIDSDVDIEELILSNIWKPVYMPYIRVYPPRNP